MVPKSGKTKAQSSPIKVKSKSIPSGRVPQQKQIAEKPVSCVKTVACISVNLSPTNDDRQHEHSTKPAVREQFSNQERQGKSPIMKF